MAHFVAHTKAIVALQWDPSGSLLLTADIAGHNFHLFRFVMADINTSVRTTCLTCATQGRGPPPWIRLRRGAPPVHPVQGRHARLRAGRRILPRQQVPELCIVTYM